MEVEGQVKATTDNDTVMLVELQVERQCITLLEVSDDFAMHLTATEAMTLAAIIMTAARKLKSLTEAKDNG